MSHEIIDHIDIDKMGTSILVKDYPDGSERLEAAMFARIGTMSPSAPGRKRVMVTSAGITAGMNAVGVKNRPSKITQMSELQRFASIGWRRLLNQWAEAIELEPGGVLLTKNELDHKSPERQEAMGVIHALLRNGNQPIINEDDVTAHDEIAFGGCDLLAAWTAYGMAHSELFGKDIRLFLMTDVNGVYEDRNDPNTRIPIIRNTDDYIHIAGGPTSQHTIGGMLAKFEAVGIAKLAGIDSWIFNPLDGDKVDAVQGKIGTYFPATTA